MYYVTCRDAGRYALLLGPYITHEEALAKVEEGRRLAERADVWAHFYSFGTCKVDSSKPGVLNKSLERGL